MALPSSGQLSINNIVGEFGGSAPHALSEYYRGGSLVPDSATNSGVPTSGQIKISDFYGAANSVWTTDLTVGVFTGKFFSLYGFDSTSSYGSLSDNTVDFKGGAECRNLSWGSSTQNLSFTIVGNHTNAGFTTMNINGNSFNRTDATYQYVSNGDPDPFTEWYWSGASNPFGTTVGAVLSVTFT